MKEQTDKHLKRLKTLMESPTHRLASMVDMEKYKMVLAHLWDSLRGVKVAVFVIGTHKETQEKKWVLYRKKPIAFVDYDDLKDPEVAYLQGKGAKEFLLQNGYEFINSNKTIKPIARPLEEENTTQTRTDRINTPLKRKINTSLNRLMKKTYFDSIPLDDIFEVLYEYGIVPLMEDNTHWDGFLLGSSSRTIISLGFKNTEHEVNGLKTYNEIENVALVLTWHKMGSGKIEVIAYVS